MTIRILLVDDHPIVRQGLKTLLEGHSEWQVIGEASDGAEAIEKAKDLHPDVMVLDVTMPRMNGLEACRLLRRQAPGLEILFVTQHDSPQTSQPSCFSRSARKPRRTISWSSANRILSLMIALSRANALTT